MAIARPGVSLRVLDASAANGTSRAVLRESRQAAKRLVHSLPDVPRLALAYSFTAAVISAYWHAAQADQPLQLKLPRRPEDIPYLVLDDTTGALAERIGTLAAQMDVGEAGYQIGEIYTALLPAKRRAQRGVYYTPPALTSRLLELATSAGVNWKTASVLDPACGGGAFLTPVALRIAEELGPCEPALLINHISRHVHGFEIDPFGAWMSQVLVEAALLDVCHEAGCRLPQLVTVCDTLEHPLNKDGFDLVIGNPPYGRVGLAPRLRAKYERSLYGHANLYGIFTDLAIRWTRRGGTIAFVTPTSFLGGQYFKSLRGLLAAEAPPVSIDLVVDRKGVFADVLQETLLAVYKRSSTIQTTSVHMIVTRSETVAEIEPAGTFTLPEHPKAPWLLPRSAEQAPLISRMRAMPYRLFDYGYQVSTGPLVWNRHKAQLYHDHVAGALPLIWAESVTPDGHFRFRAEKKNHAPFFLPKAGDAWLITRAPCVLVQRTTAKEQRRRLICAELPESFIDFHGAVVIENHLNMVRPMHAAPAISPRVLAALFNSSTVDAAFRCINGSVAVSASELEALPLPAPEEARQLETLLDQGVSQAMLDKAIHDMYFAEAAG